MLGTLESIEKAATFLPVFARVGALLVMLPILGDERVPPMSRLAMVLMVSLAVSAALDARVRVPDSIGALTLALVMEFALGLAIGTAVKVVFAGVELGGQVIGYQAGLGIANVVDPLSHAQKPLFSEFLYMIVILLALVLDVHHVFIRTIVLSFHVLPPMNVQMEGDALRLVVDLGTTVFALGFRIAAPVIGVLLLVKLGLGIVARTAPQFNIFSVGFVMLTIVGIAATMVALPYVTILMRGELNALPERLLRVMESF